MSDTQKNPRKCLTPEFRVSFPNLFKAVGFKKEKDPAKFKYSVTMLFPKNVDLSALKKAVFTAASEVHGTDKSKWPKNFELPFKDGDDKAEIDGYEGMIVVRASSKQRPGVIDRDKSVITEEDQSIYAGCYARATLVALCYGKGTEIDYGKSGVSFMLQNVQKLRDGEAFSGKTKAEDDFDAVEDDSDDADNYSEKNNSEDDDYDF